MIEVENESLINEGNEPMVFLHELQKENMYLRKELSEILSSKMFKMYKSFTFFQLRMNFHLAKNKGECILKMFTSRAFFSSWYFQEYTDVLGTAKKSHFWKLRSLNIPILSKVAKFFLHPMWHYIRYGANEGRKPNPFFDGEKYWAQNPDVEALKINPLAHYLVYGRFEGRQFPFSKYFEEYASTIKRLQIKTINIKDIKSLSTIREKAIENKTRIVIHIHVYYIDLIPVFIHYLLHILEPFDLYISIPHHLKTSEIELKFKQALTEVQRIVVRHVQNRGRNFGALIIEFGWSLLDYDVMLHIHSNKYSHNLACRSWLKHILDRLLGSENSVDFILNLFKDDAVVVYPGAFSSVAEDANSWRENRSISAQLLKKISKIDVNKFPVIEYPVGGMFWVRPKAIKSLLTAQLKYSDFPKNSKKTDGTLAHAIERIILLLAKEHFEGSCYRIVGEEDILTKIIPSFVQQEESSHLSYALERKLLNIQNVNKHPWEITKDNIPENELKEYKKSMSFLNFLPLISIVIPMSNSIPIKFLSDLFHSLLEQVYPNWQVNLIMEKKSRWSVDLIFQMFGEQKSKVKISRISKVKMDIHTIHSTIPNIHGDFFIWMNPTDTLDPRAILALVEKIQQELETTVIYSTEDTSAFWREQRKETSLKKEHSLIFGQLIAFQTTFARKHNLFVHRNTHSFLLHLKKVTDGGKFKCIEKYLYRKRNIPTSCFFCIVDASNIVERRNIKGYSIPLQVCVDARLVHRKITGTERYILELLRALSMLRFTENIQITALVQRGYVGNIQGVKWVDGNYNATIQSAHIFHKPFPASDVPNLLQLALASAAVFIPLDLISYSNPDYFANETDYTYFRNMINVSCLISTDVVAISEAGKQDMLNKIPIDGNKIHVVYLGIRTDSFLVGIKENMKELKNKYHLPKKYFLTIGTNYPHKNLETLYKAFKRVIQQYPQYYLIKTGVHYFRFPQPGLERARRDIRDHLIDLEYVADEYIPGLYTKSTALVYPSLYEGFGFPVLEAMTYGTAVIGSNSTSIPEIAGKNNALLVDATSEKKLADSMLRIISDDDLRKQLIARGRKRVKFFTWEKTAINTVRIYKNSLQKVIENPHKYEKHKKLRVIENDIFDTPCVFIVSHIRFYPSSAGNELRLFKLIRYFKKQGFRVVILVHPFLEKQTLNRQRLYEIHKYVDFYEELDTKHYISDYHVLMSSKKNTELKNFQHLELAYCPDALLQRVGELIALYNPRIVISEYIWMSRIFRVVDDSVLKIIDLHDMFSRKTSSMSKYKMKNNILITPEQERVFINRADVCIAIQKDEARAFSDLSPKCKIVTTGVNFDDIHIKQRKIKSKTSLSVLIVASKNELNLQCVEEFITKVWPMVIEKIPKATLTIVGKIVDILSNTNLASIHLIPYVESLDQVYEKATLIVNPVYMGTGLKIKSVEAIAHHKPLVSFSEGVAGMYEGEGIRPYLIVRDRKEMALQICNVLCDIKLRKKLMKKAKTYTNRFLSERAIYGDLTEIISKHVWAAKKVKILCLFLRHGITNYSTSLSTLQDWYAKQLPQFDFDIWIIDSSLTKAYDGVDIDSGYRLINGDNSQREFSVWDTILKKRANEIKAYDVIHFVTAAFNTLYTEYLHQFLPQHIGYIEENAVCVGHLDHYDKAITIESKTSQNWVRSCFFFMSVSTTYKIPSFVSHKSLKDVNMSKNYQDYITNWLSGKKMQGVSWHRKLFGKEEFAVKSLAIINEHSLSINIRKAGITIIDIGWWKKMSNILFSHLDKIPDEMEQIRQRNMN